MASPSARSGGVQYTWDSQGRMVSMSVPGATDQIQYTYDTMGHLNGINDPDDNQFQASATYGPADELDTLTYYQENSWYKGASFAYNSLWQLTGEWVNNVMFRTYTYPAGQNNGRISSLTSGTPTIRKASG